MMDADTFRPIKDPGYGNLTAKVVSRKTLEEDIEIVEKTDNLEVWSLDDSFQREEDAMWALRHYKNSSQIH